MKKKLLRSKSLMNYYPEPDSQIGDKVKIVLGLSNHTTKKNYNMLQRLKHMI